MDYTAYGVAPRLPAPPPVPDKVTTEQDKACWRIEAQLHKNTLGASPPVRKQRRTLMFAHARSLSFAVVLTAASLFGLAGEAAAMQCAKHDSMAKALTGKFKEARRAMGLVNSTGVMELYMSPQGTWTVVVTDTKGIACIAASGEEWQDVPVAVVGLDS
jgi:hypothetical protein